MQEAQLWTTVRALLPHKSKRPIQSGVELAVLLLFLSVMLSIALLELLDTTSGINKLLLTGKERMAGRTDFNFHFIIDRSKLKLSTTGTGCFNLLIFRMDITFHGFLFL